MLLGSIASHSKTVRNHTYDAISRKWPLDTPDCRVYWQRGSCLLSGPSRYVFVAVRARFDDEIDRERGGVVIPDARSVEHLDGGFLEEPGTFNVVCLVDRRRHTIFALAAFHQGELGAVREGYRSALHLRPAAVD